MASSCEKSFVEDILSFSSPGWRVAITEGFSPGQLNVNGLNTHIYVVDVEGGQFWRGAISPKAFEAMLSECDSLEFSAETRVLGAIQRMRRYAALVDHDNALVKEIVTLGAWSFAGTNILKRVQMEQELSGHWIMMFYATHDGTYINSPLVVPLEAGGTQPLQQVTLLALICKLVEMDTRNTDSPVATVLRKHGGAAIHKRFKS